LHNTNRPTVNKHNAAAAAAAAAAAVAIVYKQTKYVIEILKASVLWPI